jgi:hypothetical protein
MTARPSKSNVVDETREARSNNSAVFYAALAVLLAIAVYLVVSAGHPIAQEAAIHPPQPMTGPRSAWRAG